MLCVITHTSSKIHIGDEVTVGMGKMAQNQPTDKEYVYPNYAIATDHPTCSKIGAKILHENGTAVDSAIAALLCLGVLHPHSSGIGGGSFMMISNFDTKTVEFVNSREYAPECSSKDMAKDNHSLVNQGGLSVAIPGELSGMFYAYQKYSTKPWQELFLPAIKLAHDGHQIDETLSIALMKWEKKIKKDKKLREVFTLNETLLKNGDVFKNEILANTLEEIAKSGSADIFYKKWSVDMADEIKAQGGCVTESDISFYTVEVQEALEFKFGSNIIKVASAPSSGPVLALILNMFEGFKYTYKDLYSRPHIVYHSLIETFKFAYGLRAELGDPSFVPDALIITKNFLNKSYADEIRQRISFDHTRPQSYYLKTPSCNISTVGTTHLSVIDKYNNVVAVTSTINGYFGAKFASQKFGFVYNNEMDDFCFGSFENDYSIPSSPKNYPAFKKRPMSSMSPTIIMNQIGEPLLAIGGSGGSIITTSVAQVIIYHFLFGMSLKEAITQPRLHSQLSPDKVFFESRFNTSIIQNLITLGHKVVISDEHHGVVQAIAKIPESYEWLHHSYRKEHIHSHKSKIFAESDFRKGGVPSGG